MFVCSFISRLRDNRPWDPEITPLAFRINQVVLIRKASGVFFFFFFFLGGGGGYFVKSFHIASFP